MEPRGLRNCNPGNIRITSDRWQGLKEEQTDNDFFQFKTMEYGYRALIRTLQNYHRKHGCNTIADYINRWAPSVENNTNAYIRHVCEYLEVPSTYQPDVNDRDTMCAFAGAISTHENGRQADLDCIKRAWAML